VPALREALKVAGDWRPDLVIADYDREPKAIELAESGPRAKPLPVIVMTRRRETSVKLAAYDQGAHDIIEVPFTPDEIVARAVAALRRTRDIRTQIVPKITVGDLEIDLMREVVRVGGAEFRLTPLQHTLLYLLAGNEGEILGRDQIILDIWGPGDVVESNVVDRHVRDLRVKLQDNWKTPRFIETVPGRGYRFVSAALERLAAQA
jgi:two-component system KDP operon response regulator KdpE